MKLAKLKVLACGEKSVEKGGRRKRMRKENHILDVDVAEGKKWGKGLSREVPGA